MTKRIAKRLMKDRAKVPARHPEFVRGAKAAASVAADYNGATAHAYRLDDCILCKMNVIARKKPRKNPRAMSTPELAWMAGVAMGLAEMHRLTGNSESVCEAARNAGLTIQEAKRARAAAYDWKELKRAGVT